MAKAAKQTIHAGRLAREIAERLGVSPFFARGILSTFCDVVASHLLADRPVVLAGFGRFHLKAVGRRPMRVGAGNSRTIIVGGHSVPGWVASDTLKQRVRAATQDAPQASKVRPSRKGTVAKAGSRDRRQKAGAGSPQPVPAAPRRKGASREPGKGASRG